MREYLTDEDFAIAEANGIPKGIARSRFSSSGWSKKRAITVPYRPRQKIHLKYKEQLEANGITSNLFYARLSEGWTEERAASEPKLTKEERINRMVEGRWGENGKGKRLPKELIALAESNGISIYTLRARIGNYEWEPLRAATEPVKTQFRRK